ncbi:potassium channel protein [Sporosarcina oncorhynchi]|uniref:Potassium channel protein n=1 Tax=Sporosarcina oncorhynchi TaxID=3056444 RepID=A0ABZ0L5N1_9BACL|nr:potassium channel protein [Sporosarcina sp. T2O-4]WOV87788.1 potassium channel protein [Sporosarcina sp. T2O-4]
MYRHWLKINIRYRRLIFLLATTVLLVATAVIGFMYFEELSFFNALWMTIVSIMTIGYGDIYPTTEEGRWFALILVPLGAGIVTYGLGMGASYFIEQHLSEKVWVKRMEKQISNLSEHIVICGFGRVAQQVYKQLRDDEEDVPLIVIHDNEEDLKEALEPHVLRIIGDPTDKETLRKARVDHAQALITALSSDADNVFITLTAKSLNEDITIAARAEKDGSEDILTKAGATSVINPSIIGGRELAMSIIKPTGTVYINDLIRSEEKEFMVGEIDLNQDESIIGSTIDDADLRKEFDITLVAILRKGELISNPDLDEQLQAGDKLIVIGNQEKIEAFTINKNKGYKPQ